MNLQDYLNPFPFIAITRGIAPELAVEYSSALTDVGFRVIETPLNSPTPLKSIEHMARNLPDTVLVGAGTVTRVDQVQQVKDAGGNLIISPHCSIDIIRATKEMGLLSIPGVATPTEAFTALDAGADALKLFPAETITPAAVKAFLAVLPRQTILIPVGGIMSSNWQPYHRAGAYAFGLGSSLYSPSMSIKEVKSRACEFRQSWRKHRK